MDAKITEAISNSEELLEAYYKVPYFKALVDSGADITGILLGLIRQNQIIKQKVCDTLGLTPKVMERTLIIRDE